MAHISHLVEDRDITQNDVVGIATATWLGTLEGATEKLDGANLVYSCTNKLQPRAARSEGDIKAGGMIGAVLEAKFTGRGLVQETFGKGFDALRRSMLSLSLRGAKAAFADATVWYSAELIYVKNANVVVYDRDTLVLHERPVVRFDGSAVVPHGLEGFAAIEAGLPGMVEAAEAVGWGVLGPRKVVFRPRTDPAPLNELTRSVRAWFGGEKTLQTALKERAKADLKKFGMGEELLNAASERLSESKSAPSLTVLKNRVPTRVAAMLRASDAWVAEQIAPLEAVVIDFGAVLLAGVEPSLVSNPEAEAERIRGKLKESLSLVKKSRNQHAVDYVASHMAKLKDPDRVVTPVEGVVFPWKGKLYKLTGVFAPTNAIIGVCRYGRGKLIPPLL
jgi:hypothetical protein